MHRIALTVIREQLNESFAADQSTRTSFAERLVVIATHNGSTRQNIPTHGEDGRKRKHRLVHVIFPFPLGKARENKNFCHDLSRNTDEHTLSAANAENYGASVLSSSKPEIVLS